MYYMVNFEYRPLPTEKIINKWKRMSKDYIDRGVGSKGRNQARILVLSELSDEENGEKILLKSEEVDSYGVHHRKAKGLTHISEDAGTVYVDCLAGNPKREEDESFKGATESLGDFLTSVYPDSHRVQINAVNEDVSSHYRDVLKIPANKGYTHVGIIKQVPKKEK